MRCSVNLAVFGCGVVQRVDKVCEHGAAWMQFLVSTPSLILI